MYVCPVFVFVSQNIKFDTSIKRRAPARCTELCIATPSDVKFDAHTRLLDAKDFTAQISDARVAEHSFNIKYMSRALIPVNQNIRTDSQVYEYFIYCFPDNVSLFIQSWDNCCTMVSYVGKNYKINNNHYRIH